MKTIIFVWSVLVAVMLFFPPWEESCNVTLSGSHIESSESRGYSSVFNPPAIVSFKPGYSTIRIAQDRLLFPLAGITILAGGLLLFCRRQSFAAYFSGPIASRGVVDNS